MIDPLERDVQRARERRLVVAGCGLALGAIVLLCGLFGLWSVFVPAKRGVLVQAVETETGSPAASYTAMPTATATSTLAPTSAQIPTVTPILPTAATPPTGDLAPTEAPSSSVQPSPTAPPPAARSGPRRQGNGPALDASNMPAGRFVLDGRLDEWTGGGVPLAYPHVSPQNWRGPNDLSGTGWVAWDSDYLYLAARVIDDVHVQTQTSWNMYKGDSVELWIDANLAGDFNDANGNADDWQFGLSPGDFRRLPPEGVVYLPLRDLRLNQQVRVNAEPTNDGYTLEAQIPWSVLNVGPRDGLTLGYAIDLSDNDVPGTAIQQKEVGSDPNLQFNVPPTFGNLILQGPSSP